MQLVSKNIVLLILCSVVFISSVLPMIAISDGWISRLIMDGRKVNFGLVRACGSLSYAAMAFSVGNVLNIFGMKLLGPMFACAAILAVIASFFLEQPEHIGSADTGDRVRFFDGLKQLAKNRDFIMLCASVYMVQAGACAVHGFLAVKMAEIGGTTADLGRALFVLGLSEIPVIFFFGKLARLMKTYKYLMFAFFFHAMKLMFIALARAPSGIVFAMTLQSISYALYIVSSVTYLREIVDRRILLTAQTTLAAVAMGLSRITGYYFGGLLSELYGISFMYTVAVCFSYMGAAFFACYLYFSGRLARKKQTV
jgi:PPP family 3-phenylpropionic acid transporter